MNGVEQGEGSEEVIDLFADLNHVPIGDTDWMKYGLCSETDPALFYPEAGGSPRTAKKVCARCEVREACLEYAQINCELYGIWGGLTVRERMRARNGREEAA